MKAIYIRNLSKRYESLTAVDNLNIDIQAGEQIAILGPNGAGKTTTIKMICNLIQPTSGTVLINGFPPSNRQQVMRNIGVMLEGARNIYWRLSPWNNLQYFANLKGVHITKSVKAYIEYLLQELDLWGRRHDEVRFFSRGMQQKVAVACSLVADPQIVLLDEPTLGLDVQAHESIIQFIKNLAHTGKTVLITSHQFSFIREVTERVIIMKTRIIFDGSKQTIANQYGGSYLIKIEGTSQASIGPDWRILHQNRQETTFIGNGELTHALQRIEKLDYSLKSVEPVSLTSEIFLDLLERGQHG